MTKSGFAREIPTTHFFLAEAMLKALLVKS
jgi:hypothetical protein